MDREKIILAFQQINTLAQECLRAVGEDSKSRSREKKAGQEKNRASAQIDFTKPLRPFVKAHAKGLSGPKKFALLLGWFAKGDLKKEVAHSEIEAQWNRMTSLLEMKFNRFFPAQAKDNDWVESKKKGLYNLRPGWRDALKERQ